MRSTFASTSVSGAAAWELADIIESLDDDPRLRAISVEIVQAVSNHRTPVILAERIADMEYLASELASRGVRAGVLASQISLAERQRVIDNFADGEAMIISLTMLGQLQMGNVKPTVLIWSISHQLSAIEHTVLWAAARSGNIVVVQPAGASGTERFVVKLSTKF